MEWQIAMLPAVLEDLDRVPIHYHQMIYKRIEALRSNPHAVRRTKRIESGPYPLRAGRWEVVTWFDAAAHTILVQHIQRRLRPVR